MKKRTTVIMGASAIAFTLIAIDILPHPHFGSDTNLSKISANNLIISSAIAATTRIPNGQILNISGEVQLQRQDGRNIRPTAGTPIYPGDKLQTAQNGQITIQCADLGIKSIKSGENQLNSCLLASDKSKSECNKNLIRCPDRGDDKIAWNNAPIPYIISPRRTQLLGNKPTLRWNPVAGATSYKLSILEKNAKLNWEMTVKGTEAVYPGEPVLKPGVKYRLIVETNTGVSSESPLSEGDSEFSLLDEKEVERVKEAVGAIEQQVQNAASQKLAIAQVYRSANLIAEAIEILESLPAAGVETAPIYRKLGEMYQGRSQLMPQAEIYYKRAIDKAKPDDIEELTDARYGLAQVYSSMRNYPEAIQYLKLAKEGYQTLKDLLMVEKIGKQLQDAQRRKDRQ
ncbi:tetratricopeptide repeat protein [Lyngbya sp. CCAP 1446/10]|uniref:tetratricopeptide repeat protein n=1 Tax=Lyngbya sp. CCAP 1446/10 TaxID=439293 RepID=UPI002237A287|nr:tetratricopeptide repeat protein [Lyngbya sp. CCAP 1446/10]MCW6051859.1 tetratricopeptide repeat protein [Lyngbya sp. CCAP 1446/10]